MNRIFFSIVVLWLFGSSCSDSCSNKIIDIRLSSPANNTIKVQVDVNTAEAVEIAVEYWPKGDTSGMATTIRTKAGKNHRFVLTSLLPQKDYLYKVITSTGNCFSKSKEYSFTTPGFPLWIHDYFKVICPDSSVVPKTFNEGYMMIYRRETPGIVFIIDKDGQIRWYHQLNGTGIKVAHFTGSNSIISILGDESYQTSYGNEIMELSLTGDTLLHLKKGMNDFRQTVHHEIFLNDKQEVVTISSEEKVMDLSSRGGSKTDTVKTDGILVLDRNGKQVWKWTVFDAFDPLMDKNIVKDKADWMHANSLSLDKDGNYLLSFYNNGQIWKIDAVSGKLIWKFGKGGDFKLDQGSFFDNSHAAHINANNDLMFFDNGTAKQLSRTVSYKLDEAGKKAALVFDIPLPPDVYSERMGSAYMVNDTTVLHTSSKKNTIMLTNLKGKFLWAMKSNMMPYRVEFLPKERLKPYIIN
jgi:arylsulfate sulfotransferase